MALHIVIDGYNLIGAKGGMGKDLEGERKKLIQRLKTYKKLKGAKITVVFDGTGSFSLAREKQMQMGIEVIFSRANETADSILKQYSERMREGLTLVTSDMEVRGFAERRGSVVVSSWEFLERLEFSEYAEIKGAMDEEEDYPVKQEKGLSRRLSKKERLKAKRIRKL